MEEFLDYEMQPLKPLKSLCCLRAMKCHSYATLRMTPSQMLKILLPTINEVNKGPAGCQKPQTIISIPYIALDRKYFAHSVAV